jgi:hypothetical protein
MKAWEESRQLKLRVFDETQKKPIDGVDFLSLTIEQLKFFLTKAIGGCRYTKGGMSFAKLSIFRSRVIAQIDDVFSELGGKFEVHEWLISAAWLILTQFETTFLIESD